MRQENLRVPKEPTPAVNRWTLPNLCLKKLCVYKTRCCWSTVFSWWPLLAPACWKEIFFSATVLWETILITLLFLCKPGDERAQNTEEKNTANKKTLTLVVNWGMLENQWQSKGRSEVLCFGKDYLNFSQQAPLEMKMKRSRAFPLCFSITPCMRPYVFVLILLSPCSPSVPLSYRQVVRVPWAPRGFSLFSDLPVKQHSMWSATQLLTQVSISRDALFPHPL